MLLWWLSLIQLCISKHNLLAFFFLSAFKTQVFSRGLFVPLNLCVVVSAAEMSCMFVYKENKNPIMFALEFCRPGVRKQQVQLSCFFPFTLWNLFLSCHTHPYLQGTIMQSQLPGQAIVDFCTVVMFFSVHPQSGNADKEEPFFLHCVYIFSTKYQQSICDGELEIFIGK